MPLTDTAVRLAKPGAKTIKKADGKGLLLYITPAGGKWWRFAFRFNGKQKLLSLGIYPSISLAQARAMRDEYRALLAQGVDPGERRKEIKAETVETFERVARDWHARFKPGWSTTHARTLMERLEQHVFQHIGKVPIADIRAPAVLAVLRRIEAQGKAATAHRTRTTIGQVMRYAVSTGLAEMDPTPSLKGALAPAQTEHFPAVLEPAEIGKVLRLLHAYEGSPEVMAALKLGPLLFVRPGELRIMKWADIDLETREWRFTLPKTKTPHIVPLSAAVVEIIEGLRPLTGRKTYVMPSTRAPDGRRPLSVGAVLAAYRTLGIGRDTLVGHGWRATARTLLVEALNFRPDIVEQQLGHKVRDPLGRAYNRTQFLDDRRAMMETWSRYLEGLRTVDAENVISIGRKAG